MSGDDEDFRAELRGFIAENLPPDMAARTLRGYHPHKPDVVYWTRRLHRRGWSVPHWPVEHGGPGWSETQRLIFEEESLLAGCPAISPQGLHLVGPIIYTYGNATQKEHFLPGIRSGDTLWAQGFSEPNAGSDLAALQTRAVRDGGSYIVNGQKIWTSEAHYSEWVFLLVRTSTEGRKQAGISFLLADLASPGITIRPITGIDGGHVLNEVFLDDVRVPAENLIGEENKGWTYAKILLGAERASTAEVGRCKMLLARLKRIAAERSLMEDSVFAARVAELDIDLLAQEATLWRVIAEEAVEFTAAAPTPSILKIRGTELVQRIGALMIEALGQDALPDYPQADYFFGPPAGWSGAEAAPGIVADFLYRRAATIYGGTNEVQRNLIAAALLRS